MNSSSPAAAVQCTATRPRVGLAAPVSQLATLYGGSFSLHGPGISAVGVMAGAGAFLGWLGAQLSVSLSLRKFD